MKREILASWMLVVVFFSEGIAQNSIQELRRIDPLLEIRIDQFSKHLFHCQAEITTIKTIDQANTKTNSAGKVIVKNGRYGMLFSFSVASQPSKEYCIGKNEKYAFELKKGGESKEWVLSAIKNISGKPKIGPPWDVLLTEENHVKNMKPFLVFREWWPDFIKSTQFTFNIGETENEHIIVRFQNIKKEPDKKNQDFFYRNGHFVLDPKNYWVVKSYEVDLVWPLGEKGIVKGQSEYQRDDKGFPLPKKIQISEFYKNPVQEMITTEDFFVSNNEPDPEEFRLSFFGLPEPVNVEWKKPWQFNGLYLLLGSGVLFFFAIVFRKIRKKAQGSVN